MLQDVCTEMQETWYDSKTGVEEKIVHSMFSSVANGRHDDLGLLPKNKGMINIHLKSAAQASQKTIVIYAEYEGMMEIDSIQGATLMGVH